MAGFLEVNKELAEAIKQIELKTFDLDKATIDFLESRAKYENEFSRFLLESKLKNSELTQSETKATAINLSYPTKLEMIRAQSTYQRLKNEIKSLRDKVECYRELSFNLRRESRI